MPQQSLVGRTVAGYRLGEYIGEGGTATVYRSDHPERGKAAVKVLRPKLSKDPVAVKRFLREAEYGRRVEHPNVVQTYDFGDTDDLYYLALEWAPGEPLATFATRSGPVAPQLASKIVEQIGAALAAAHAAGVIHRDLKPANIMYDPASQGAMLLDFGIARDADLQPEDRLTRAGFFVGTLQYVAPETLSGELVGEQADVYSLATIAYYLMTGQLPFPGRTPRELFQQLLSQEPTPLNDAVKGLKFSPALNDAVMNGLQRDLKSRSPTVAQFAQEFCLTANGEEPPKSGFLSKLFRSGG
jgi:serine/threonine protein kinase